MMSRKTRRALPFVEQARLLAHDLATGKAKPGEVAEQFGERGWDVKLVEHKDGFNLQAGIATKPGDEPRVPPS